MNRDLYAALVCLLRVSALHTESHVMLFHDVGIVVIVPGNMLHSVKVLSLPLLSPPSPNNAATDFIKRITKMGYSLNRLRDR